MEAHQLMEADFRQMPETQQYLSRRTQHTLLRGGYVTAEDLMLASGEELMRIHNFGPQALVEVSAWRDALMESDAELYRTTLYEVVRAMDETLSVVAERRAKAAMRVIWQLIAKGPFTASHIRQMLIEPTNNEVSNG